MIAEQITDLRAEFIAGSWLEDGISSESILFRPLGSFKRRSHLDVEAVMEQEMGNFKGKVIESNRSGLYDYLPEQLFHLPSSTSINTLKKKVDEIRLQREKEQKSRLFFLPLEQEFFQNRVDLTLLEQKAFELHPDSGFLAQLKEFWQAPDSIDEDTFLRLMPVLPFVSENRGDMMVAERVLSSVLDLPVHIVNAFGKKVEIPGNASLNASRLGIDTLLGGEMEPYAPELTVEILIPDQEMLERYLGDHDFDILVKWLLEWFVPVECDYQVQLKPDPNATSFQLAVENGIAPRLGYATL